MMTGQFQALLLQLFGIFINTWVDFGTSGMI